MRFKEVDPDKEYELEELQEYVVERDNRLCLICGKAGSHVHHIIFRSHGGRHYTNNLALLCFQCHDSLHHGKLKKIAVEIKRLLVKAVFHNEKRFKKRLT